ncbi:hypothetical protein DFQ03_2835 [Maribacter caenipelagi]|uniref:Uncharacterized protein n=1 Tax=Maribacter caenipelagi TaxID=1447781 RepID=A0A4R7D005_9FLAO|nr:hypothetical protein [Maribacter caenipelagi]TDS13542.1 hypothetical protein DFQ03_2835 [Maribacter caenipelagi]
MNDDIVDILNKLARYKITAYKAIALLYQLSISDGDYKHDALISIRNKFYIYLSNNALNLEKRIELLDSLKKDFGITESLIHIYGSILKTERFFGTTNGESEVDNYQDVDIKNYNEIKEYYKYAFEALIDALNTNDSYLLELIEQKIIERLQEQYRYGNYEIIFSLIRKLVVKQGNLPIKLRSNIDALIISQPKLIKEDILSLKAFLEEFKIETTEEELKTIIIDAPYLSERNENGSYNDLSQKRAKDLAKKYIENKVDWETSLPNLLVNEQKQTYHFAEKIGQSDYNHHSLLENAFSFLDRIDKEQHNILFINGLVHGVDNDDFTRKAIDLALNNKNTIEIGIHLTRFLKPILLSDLALIKPFLIQNPNYLRLLEYIDILHLTNDELIELTSWLNNINLSFTLEILDRVIRNEPRRWIALKEIVNPLIYQKEILYNTSFINNSLHIEELIKVSVIDNPNIKNINFILSEIFECYEDFSFQNSTLLNSLVYFFLDQYWDKSWPLIGDYIIEKQNVPLTFSYLLSSISFDNSKLLEWVKEKPGNREVVAMHCLKIFQKYNQDDSKLKFEPEVISLIDNYGNNRKMLAKLEESLTSYTIHTNSAELLYLRRKELVQTLSNHPLEEVRVFSSKMSAKFDLLIEQERNFETNHNLRF